MVFKSKRLLVLTGAKSWHLKISHSKSHEAWGSHTGTRRPLEFKMGWKASGLPFLPLEWPLQDFRQGRLSLDISTAKGMAGTSHCNRILASVWLEKHFYFISRDACRRALFLLSVSWLWPRIKDKKGGVSCPKAQFPSWIRTAVLGGGSEYVSWITERWFRHQRLPFFWFSYFMWLSSKALISITGVLFVSFVTVLGVKAAKRSLTTVTSLVVLWLLK